MRRLKCAAPLEYTVLPGGEERGNDMKADVAVIGAGPIGLSFACALAAHGLSVVLIDKQPLDALREPAFDGREIALTHATQDILKRDRKSTRLNSSHVAISYAVFCLKKKTSK